MTMLKRVRLYLIRKKSRSVILIGIFFLTSNLVITGIALKSSTDKEEKKFAEASEAVSE